VAGHECRRLDYPRSKIIRPRRAAPSVISNSNFMHEVWEDSRRAQADTPALYTQSRGRIAPNVFRDADFIRRVAAAPNPPYGPRYDRQMRNVPDLAIRTLALKPA
jgi:hypothetical protein